MTVLPPPDREFGQAGDVHEVPGAAPVEVQVDHQIGSSRDRDRVGMRGLDLEGLGQGAGEQNVHHGRRSVYPITP